MCITTIENGEVEIVEICGEKFRLHWTKEKRKFMGKNSVVPKGAIVDLYCIAKIGKSTKGFFTYNGKKYFAPIRLLWRIKS